MPAWSVPGIHSVLKPCIRFRRIRMSCSVLFSAWPRCSAPVTFGGGMTMQYGLAAGIRLRVEIARLLPLLVDPLLGGRVIESVGKDSAENAPDMVAFVLLSVTTAIR